MFGLQVGAAFVPPPKQPPAVAKCRKVNSRRSIPPLGAIAGTELQSDLLVAIRNPQLIEFVGAGAIEAASVSAFCFRDLFGGTP